LTEAGIFVQCPVVFLKHLTVQVQTLLSVNKMQQAKSFEPPAAPPLQYEVTHQWSASRSDRLCLFKRHNPVKLRVNRRLSKSGRGLSYVRRNRRRSFKP